MAHFARVEDGIVREVLVVSDENAPDPFPEGEAAGAAFLNSIGLTGDWKQTSYNGNFRGMYAGIGYTFDPDAGEHGEFIAPQVEVPLEEVEESDE